MTYLFHATKGIFIKFYIEEETKNEKERKLNGAKMDSMDQHPGAVSYFLDVTFGLTLLGLGDSKFDRDLSPLKSTDFSRILS